MQVRVDWKAVVRETPAGGLLRLRSDAAARIWPEGEVRAFAAEIGVPHSDGLFRLSSELADRDPATPGWAFVEPMEPLPFDTAHGRFQQLGMLRQASVHVRLEDGTIWVDDPDAEVGHELIHRDLSSLSYLVYKVAAEKPLPEEDPTPYDWADVEEIIRADTTAWDRLPFESGARFWEGYLEDYPLL
ncbi:SUKH-4 family immunity protein [Kitasatospora sp. NPDC094015]|uniref:SUKH-4 family immunity protein n=1 Tax=Kitasatospora sp. NPDC094015 TaxID=3155205 RepID=UPI00331750D7